MLEDRIFVCTHCGKIYTEKIPSEFAYIVDRNLNRMCDQCVAQYDRAITDQYINF